MITVTENAVKDVERIAHKAAGASATCGMNLIVPILRQLEQRARAGQTDCAPAQVLEARHARDRIVAFLNPYLDSLRTASK